jgi:hypothetical protein
VYKRTRRTGKVVFSFTAQRKKERKKERKKGAQRNYLTAADCMDARSLTFAVYFFALV